MKNERKIRNIIFIPSLMVFSIWMVKLVEYFFHLDFSNFGVYPMHVEGLPGIVLHQLIHGDFKHLASNTIPTFVLLTGIFYFYPKVAFNIFTYSYLLTGILLFLMGRETYHIGASGLIYAYAAFLFLGGILCSNRNMIAISLLVVFLYGSLIWGLFPQENNISWEGHLSGFLTGIAFAFVYRDYGPKRKLASWEREHQNANDEDIPQIDFGWIDLHDYPAEIKEQNLFNSVGIKYWKLGDKRIFKKPQKPKRKFFSNYLFSGWKPEDDVIKE